MFSHRSRFRFFVLLMCSLVYAYLFVNFNNGTTFSDMVRAFEIKTQKLFGTNCTNVYRDEIHGEHVTRSVRPITDKDSLSIKRDFVVSSDGNSFIFGATGINSTSARVWDQFNVYGHRYYATEGDGTLICCLKYQDGEVSQLPVAENRRHFATGSVPLPLFNVVCNNTRYTRADDTNGLEIPIGISVIYDGTTCVSPSVGFIKPYFPLRQADNTLAITTKISHGNLSPDLLITWMEAYLWLGVDKVITHALSNLSSDARKVLRYYAEKNVLEIHDYFLPELAAVPRSLPVQWLQTWTDAAVPMFDAYARNIGYTYFSVIDWDEFIIPYGNRTLKQLMDDLFTKHNNAAGFQFKTQFFLTSAEPEESNILLKRFVHRLRQDPVLNRRKLTFKPAMARLRGSHGIAPKPGYQSLICPVSTAYIRHYRSCLPRDTTSTDCVVASELDLVRDTTTSDWVDNIAIDIQRAKEAIFPDQS